ncbi:MAG: D-glycero-beta-D-manno-heptose-7-phosphate kinase [Gemmatimonadetes bacterium]|nr:D-glycero-beta-D-manno-heptose-7-phosphate kinase [Gemmatimonadota bacterium]
MNRTRLETLLHSAPKLRIAVVGDAMLDVYLRGDVDRISPEAPVPVVRVRDRKDALGGAANVAQNVAALGAAAELVALTGSDDAGARLRGMLGAMGADTRGLVKSSRPTTTKTRVLARAQQLLRVDEEVDSDCLDSEVEQLIAAIDRAVADADALVLEDYNKGVLVPAVIKRAISRARIKGIPIVVDPKYHNFFEYKGATVFKPNRRELEAALGAAVDLEHPDALPLVLERLGVDSLLLTLSEKGMALVQTADGGRSTVDGAAKGAEERRHTTAAKAGAVRIDRIPTTAREVYDVVGAGDTVTAYLAATLAAGATPLEAAVVANYAAGVEVGKLGAATVSPQEVLEAFDGHVG